MKQSCVLNYMAIDFVTIKVAIQRMTSSVFTKLAITVCYAVSTKADDASTASSSKRQTRGTLGLCLQSVYLFIRFLRTLLV